MKARGFSTLFSHVHVLGGERDVLIWIKQRWKSPRIWNLMINLIALLPQQKRPTILLKKQAVRPEFQRSYCGEYEWFTLYFSIINLISIYT